MTAMRDMEPPRAELRGFARLTRDSLVLSSGLLVGKAFGILLLPILARLLTPEDLGRMDVVVSVASAATVIVILDLDSAAVRTYFDRPLASDRASLLATWYCMTGIAAVLLALVLVVFAAPISQLLLGSSAFGNTVAAGALVVGGGAFQIVALTILRAAGRTLKYALVSGGGLAIYGVMTVILLIGWQASPTSPILATGLGFGVSAALGAWWVRDIAFGPPKLADAGILLRLSLPLVPAGIGAVGVELLNRSFLLLGSGAAEVAYYTVGLRIASIAGLTVAAFQLAWSPHIFAMGDSPVSRRRIARQGLAIVSLVAAGAVVVAAVAPEAITVVAGTRYEPALPAIGWSLLAVIASGLYLILSTPSALARRFGDIGVASALGLIATLVVNLLLARPFGGAATAFAVMVGQLVAASVVTLRGRAHVGMRWQWRSLALVAGSASVVVVVSTVLPFHPPLGLRIALAAGFVVVGAWTLFRSLGASRVTEGDGLA